MTVDATDDSTPIKRALRAIDALQAKLEQAEAARHEPVAVVGLGCRFPGGADDADSFWELLRAGAEAISEVPSDRWDIDAYYHPDPDHPGTMSTRRAGFLDDVRGFEPQFFGIAPREAASMDPQQRLLLEVVWEALEHAGTAPDRLGGSRTGVFVGVTSGDYSQLQLNQAGVGALDAYYASGVAHSIVSGRVSYVLGLQGPSLTLDTACSSSLVAVHLAVQSLRTGECRMALAGGVNLILSPENSITLSRYHMLAPDGRCKAFDAEADGFVRGEGCGVVVLKLLRDAVADGDRVLAVVRGSAVNQDGASSGLTAPNGPAQEAVLRDALADAGVAAADVDYVEAHGTGTALGDPIEVQALAAVYGQGRDEDRALLIGSVKPNIGHLESAAGVAGLIKAVLAMQHGTVPPNLHLTRPNPLIDWDDLPVAVPTEATTWPSVSRPRRAAVSGFGFSGTNAHVVLEAPPAAPTPAAPTPAGGDAGEGSDLSAARLLVLSGRTPAGVRDLAGRWAKALSSDVDLDAVCATGSRGRAQLGHRVGVVAGSVDELRQALEAHSAGDATAVAVEAELDRVDPPRVGFVMSGQGSQWAGMGRGLYGAEPVFRAALDRCAAAWDAVVSGPGLLEVLWTGAGLDRTEVTQPALFSLEWALAQLWESWGVVPSALLGHSVGEFVAAALAGVMSPEDGLRLVAARGRLMGALPDGGSMVAIMASAAEVERALEELGPDRRARVGVAAVNGSAHTVVSGAAEIVDAVAAPFAERGVRTSTLQVSHPFHSPLMAPMVEAFGAVVAEVELSAPDRRVVSNVTGAVVGAELADPDYWVRHVLAPVRFADGVEAMRAAGVDVFVEIGPHPVLVGMAAADAPAPGEVWFGSLRRGRDDHRQVLGALAGVWAAGAPVAWDLVESAGAGATPATLPATVFRREPYWMAPTTLATGAPAAPVGPDELNPILGRRLPSPLAAVTFEAALTTQRLPILADHRVFGATILPATAFLEAALDALAEVTGGTELQQVLIHEPLVAGPEPVTMHTVVQPADGGVAVEVFSLHGTGWRRHLTARGPANPGALSPATDLTAARARVTREVGADEHYATLAANDLDFGPTLRGVQRIWVGPDEVLGELATTGDDHTRYRANPALVDAAVQVIAAAATDGGIHLPFSIDRVEWRRPVGDRATSHVVLGGAGQGTLTADVEVLDESGTPSVVLHGLILKHADPSVLRRAGGADASPLHRVVWEPVDVAVASGDTSLIDPGRLASAAAEGIDSLPTRFDLVEYQGLLDALEELSTGYVLAALRGLGVELVPGRRFSPAELPVVPAHRELLGELLDLLVDDGVLRRWGDQLEVVEAPVVDLGEARLEALLERYPRGRGELALTSRCGTGLADALRGDADPLQLLFPGGSVADAEHMYQHSPFSMATAAQVGDAVAAIGAAGGPTRPLRVLEIGGGTGGTTSCVLDHLPPGSSYTFTDISPHFLPRARTKFADFPSFETMLLDIEGDLRAQGLDGRRFDLVVGANVLHATADLAATFANVGRLLAPGGLLVMSEMVRPQRFISITFGLTEGWWRFRDRELRPASLLLDRDGWVEFLAGAGYRDPVAVANTGADTPDGMGVQAVILAGAPDGPSVELAAGQRSWLVLGDGGGVGDDLAAAVRARGGEAVVVADATRADLDTAVAAAPPGGFDVAVHLWALDAPADAEAEVATRLRRPLGGAFDLVQTVLAASPNTRVCLVTRGAQGAGATVPDPDQASLWGLSRTLRLEHPELATMVVDLDPSPVALVGPDLLDALLAGDGEDEVALRAGTRLVPRLRPAAAPDSAPSTPQVLTFAARGAIDELVVRPAERRPPGVGEVEIEVLAAALNFKDVLNVLDMYPGDPGPLGGECAGIVTSVGAGVTHLAVGDAVMAVAPGSMRTFVTCDATMVVPKPAGTGFAEAAGTLIAHVTARFALDEVAGLQAGERVLVHAAAGGVGLAAVAAAQRVGAEVFATAGSERKRALLRALGVAHVYDSRSLDFAEGVMADTDGAGVDVVLNSLTGEAVARSIDVLAEGGRFVEIGKRGLVDGGFPSGRSYHVVDWGATAQDDPARVRALVDGVVADARAGSLLRLPFRTYAFDDARAAFRLMAQGRHVGKVVLAMPAADARPTPAVRSEATYLVTGGLGGLGLLTAGHLVAQGARRVVLMGRHEPTSGALEAIDAMRADGVEVVVALGDVARADDVERAVAAADVDGFPLRGVFHAAGTLDDGAVGQLTWDRIAPVLRAKIDGPARLDRATRHIPLDLFVAYGSIASYVGSPGQANHAAGNTALDAYAVARAASGRRGMTIAWGAWAEVGAAVDRGIADQALARGQRSFTVAEGLAALDECLELGAADVAASSIDWARLAQRFAGHPPPIFADLVERATPVAAAPSVVASSAVPDGLRERLASAPAARRPTMVLDLVRGQAAHVLALPAADLGDSTPLSELGLDSLMAVELRNLLGTQLALDEPLPATLVFDHPSVQAIAEHLTTVLVDVFPVAPAPAEPEGSVAATGSPDRRPSSASASVSSLLDDLENLSDEELEARFLRKDES